MEINRNNDSFKHDEWKGCYERILEPPEKYQQIFIWFIENFDDIVKMCEESQLSEQEVLCIRQRAVEREDAVLEFLMILKGVLDSSKYNKN